VVKKTYVLGYLKNLDLEGTGRSVPSWLVKRYMSQEIVYHVGQGGVVWVQPALYFLHICFYTSHTAQKDILTCVSYSR
jgi:hypothetical protein